MLPCPEVSVCQKEMLLGAGCGINEMIIQSEKKNRHGYTYLDLLGVLEDRTIHKWLGLWNNPKLTDLVHLVLLSYSK